MFKFQYIQQKNWAWGYNLIAIDEHHCQSSKSFSKSYLMVIAIFFDTLIPYVASPLMVGLGMYLQLRQLECVRLDQVCSKRERLYCTEEKKQKRRGEGFNHESVRQSQVEKNIILLKSYSLYFLFFLKKRKIVCEVG